MHDGICSPSPTTIYLKTKLTEDDAFWTKLYAKLMAEFEIERCRQSWPKSYLHLHEGPTLGLPGGFRRSLTGPGGQW